MSQFHELINRNTPTLVDFSANWCEPCRKMPPILNEVKAELGDSVNIIKVDVQKDKKAAHKYEITNIPTLLLFKNGKVIWRKSGVTGAREISNAVKKRS